MKVLVANRGEIARRIFSTCHKLGHGTVAVHSDADATAPFAIEADESVRLPGNAPGDTYLRADLIIEAALATGADAIHPGYGFLSENADFARSVSKAGLTWIGPPAEAIEAMGSKIEAKRRMAEAGVPILEVDPATATAADYPLLVKASAGGGGRGMRIVRDADQLETELARASAEAGSAFGDDTVFVEPYLPTARHIEVQVLADQYGTVWVVGDRDCSIQRRHQKVIEEAPAPGIDNVREALHAAARTAAAAVDYQGAGTIEFLLAGDRFYFLEMNTRLQVEHPVTECVTGTDLVQWQLDIAEGARLGATEPVSSGHAIEVRLYAEDPTNDWAPQTGRLRQFDIDGEPFALSGFGVRVDSGVRAGDQIGVHYDAMIAKIIAYGPHRAAAIRQLDRALRTSRIGGVATNLALLRTILADDTFVAAEVHTSLLDQQLAQWTTQSAEPVDRAVAVAAIAHATVEASGAQVLARIPVAFRNVPSQPRVRRYQRGDQELAVAYRQTHRGLQLVEHPDWLVELSGTTARLTIGGVATGYQVAVHPAAVDVYGPDGPFSFDLVPTFVDPAEVVAEGSLVAPMPATVTAVNVQTGSEVAAGDPVVVLEAMKMQHTITAPTDGIVGDIAVMVGQQVDAGAVLTVIEDQGAAS